jgi:hypothetical protein
MHSKEKVKAFVGFVEKQAKADNFVRLTMEWLS